MILAEDGNIKILYVFAERSRGPGSKVSREIWEAGGTWLFRARSCVGVFDFYLFVSNVDIIIASTPGSSVTQMKSALHNGAFFFIFVKLFSCLCSRPP